MGEFLEFGGISFGFPFFDFQTIKAWHSLHLGTERYMTPPDGARLVARDLYRSHGTNVVPSGFVIYLYLVP